MRSRFRWRLRLRDVTPLTTVVMATVAELKEVLKDTLEKRGVLGQLKARIRAEVFSALDDQHEPRPSLCHENLLLNELIREYLEFNQYKYTASVLHAESGQPEVPLDRQFLINELNIVEDPNRKAIPLLYGILSQFLHSNREEKVCNPFQKASAAQISKTHLSREAEKNEIDLPDPGRMAASSTGHPFIVRGPYR